MRLSPAKLIPRLTPGLGLLLLLASQEKLCPWLDEVPDQGRQATAPGQRDSESQPDAPKVPPPSLASTLPDVIMPRRPDRAPGGAALPRLRGRLARPALSGAGGGCAGSGDWPAAGWPGGASPRPDPAIGTRRAAPRRPGRLSYKPLFLTIISYTGPPGG